MLYVPYHSCTSQCLQNLEIHCLVGLLSCVFPDGAATIRIMSWLPASFSSLANSCDANL